MKLHGVVLLMSSVLMLGNVAHGWQQGSGDASEIWGGRGVTMRMTAEGATLEFDCAHGNIAQAIKPDAQGEFTASGTYTAERGGPVQKANPASDKPATYHGTIKGDSMQLVIKLSDNETLPSLTLTRGNAGRLVRCR